MADAKKIYTELRQPLLRSGAILGGLLILMSTAGAFNSYMSKARQDAEQTFQGLVLDYRTALQSEQILHTETERFALLAAQGIVGAEPRLRWVEDVRDTAARAGLVSISYEIEPREPSTMAMATGSYQLFSSLMRLKVDLRHEGDLLTFLNLLESRRGGLFELSACTLRNSREKKIVSLQEANLKADCELRWYTLDSGDAAPMEVAE